MLAVGEPAAWSLASQPTAKATPLEWFAARWLRAPVKNELYENEKATHHPHQHDLREISLADLGPLFACSMLLHSAMFQCLHLQEGHVLQIWKLQRSRLADEKLLRMVCRSCAGWWVAQMPWSMHSFLLPPLPSSRALWQGAISHGTSPSKFYKPEPGEIEEVRHNNLSTAYPNWLDFVNVPISQSEQVERCTVCDTRCTIKVK